MEQRNISRRSNELSVIMTSVDERFEELIAKLRSPKLARQNMFANSQTRVRLRPSVVSRAIKQKATFTTSTPMPVNRKLTFTPDGETVSQISSGCNSEQKKNKSVNLSALNNSSDKENAPQKELASVIELSSLHNQLKDDENFKNKKANLSVVINKITNVDKSVLLNKSVQKSAKKSLSAKKKLARNVWSHVKERQTQTGESLNKNCNHSLSPSAESSSSDFSDLLRECERKSLVKNRLQTVSPSNLPQGRKSLNVAAPWRAPSGLNDDIHQPTYMHNLDEDSTSDDDTFLPKPPPRKKVFTNKRSQKNKATEKDVVTNNRSSKRNKTTVVDGNQNTVESTALETSQRIIINGCKEPVTIAGNKNVVEKATPVSHSEESSTKAVTSNRKKIKATASKEIEKDKDLGERVETTRKYIDEPKTSSKMANNKNTAEKNTFITHSEKSNFKSPKQNRKKTKDVAFHQLQSEEESGSSLETPPKQIDEHKTSTKMANNKNKAEKATFINHLEESNTAVSTQKRKKTKDTASKQFENEDVGRRVEASEKHIDEPKTPTKVTNNKNMAEKATSISHLEKSNSKSSKQNRKKIKDAASQQMESEEESGSSVETPSKHISAYKTPTKMTSNKNKAEKGTSVSHLEETSRKHTDQFKTPTKVTSSRKVSEKATSISNLEEGERRCSERLQRNNNITNNKSTAEKATSISHLEEVKTKTPYQNRKKSTTRLFEDEREGPGSSYEEAHGGVETNEIFAENIDTQDRNLDLQEEQVPQTSNNSGQKKKKNLGKRTVSDLEEFDDRNLAETTSKNKKQLVVILTRGSSFDQTSPRTTIEEPLNVQGVPEEFARPEVIQKTTNKEKGKKKATVLTDNRSSEKETKKQRTNAGSLSSYEESSDNSTLRRSTRERKPRRPPPYVNAIKCNSVTQYNRVLKSVPNASLPLPSELTSYLSTSKRVSRNQRTTLYSNLDSRCTVSPIREEVNEDEIPQPGTSSEKSIRKSIKSGRISKKGSCNKKQNKQKVVKDVLKTITSVNNIEGNSISIENIYKSVQPSKLQISSMKLNEEKIQSVNGVGMSIEVHDPEGNSLGYLKIAPGKCTQKETANKQMIFYVQKGRARVNINNKNNIFGVETSFQVREGNEYYIENINKRCNLLLLFVFRNK